MATLPTPAEKARMVLDICKLRNCRPGHVLDSRNLTYYAATNRVPMDDLYGGVDHCKEQGWLEDGPRRETFRLTEAGFAKM